VTAEIRPGATFSVGEQRVLFPMTPFVRSGGVPSYDVTADGRRFLTIREGDPSQQSELIIAENWLGGLKAKGGR